MLHSEGQQHKSSCSKNVNSLVLPKWQSWVFNVTLFLPLFLDSVSECARPNVFSAPAHAAILTAITFFKLPARWQLKLHHLVSPKQQVLLPSIWSSRGLQSAVRVPRQSFPVSPQEGQQEDEEEGGERAWACLHQRDHTVGHGWDKDQKDSHKGQQHIDKFSQEGPGCGVFQPLQLDDLLLLLLELHLRDPGLTRLQRLLQRARRTTTTSLSKVTLEIHNILYTYWPLYCALLIFC